MKAIRVLVDGKEKLIILEKKECIFCNQLFQPLRRKTKYCSSFCWSKNYYQTHLKQINDYRDKARHGGKKQELIEKFGLKCVKCGKSGSSSEIVAHHKTFNPLEHEHQELLCLACHCRLHHSVPKKNVTKEDIEKAINETYNLEDACKILGINRSSLYWKRKKFGLNFNAKFNEKVITKKQIEEAIKSTNGNKKEAAKLLGINKTTLYDKLHKLGLIN